MSAALEPLSYGKDLPPQGLGEEYYETFVVPACIRGGGPSNGFTSSGMNAVRFSDIGLDTDTKQAARELARYQKSAKSYMVFNSFMEAVNGNFSTGKESGC